MSPNRCQPCLRSKYPPCGGGLGRGVQLRPFHGDRTPIPSIAVNPSQVPLAPRSSRGSPSSTISPARGEIGVLHSRLANAPRSLLLVPAEDQHLELMVGR